MDLYSADAEACNLAGNLEDSNMYCDKILEQESFSVLEKSRANQVRSRRFIAAMKTEEARLFQLNVLDQLGFQFPLYERFLQD